MKITKIVFGCALAAGIGCLCLLRTPKAGAADGDAPALGRGSIQIPAIINAGFNVWAKQEISSYAFDVWKKGGLLEDDKKPAALATYFSRVDRVLGNYKSYEAVQEKPINSGSKILYLSINFEHSAVYARFLLYRTDKDWVVQNMDFSLKPEAVMPWLAFAGDTDQQQ